MKKLVLLFALSLFVFTVTAQEIPKWKITEIENKISTSAGEILVFNFWATFCKPCVAEIPSFIELSSKYKASNVNLVLVSLDLPSYYPKKIAAFAKKHAFNANLAWLQETDADYFCPKVDSTWSGSIPATLFVNTRTGQRSFVEGEMEPKQFEDELTKLGATVSGL